MEKTNITEQQGLSGILMLLTIFRNIYSIKINDYSKATDIAFKYRNRFFCKKYRNNVTDQCCGYGICLSCPINHIPGSTWNDSGLCTLDDYIRKICSQIDNDKYKKS